MRQQTHGKVGSKLRDDEEIERIRLILLIRRIVREEMEQAFDDHLKDYEHKEKPAEEEALP